MKHSASAMMILAILANMAYLGLQIAGELQQDFQAEELEHRTESH